MTPLELLDSLRDSRTPHAEPRRPGVVYMCSVCHVCSADEVVEARHVCSRCAPVALARSGGPHLATGIE